MILEIILGFICLVFVFVIFNLTKKVEQLEDDKEFYEAYINNFAETIESVSSKLKQIDNRGTFESDDEVGFFFTYIKELQKEVSNLIGQTETGEMNESDNTINREEG